MIQGNAILEELSAFRTQLREHEAPYRPFLNLSVWRPIRDIALDWSAIFLSVASVHYAAAWLAPLAIIIIANRQRALGNILHDAGHRNLHRSSSINDSLAMLLVAPALFACIKSYRANHFSHHLYLGDPIRDPDYLTPPSASSGLTWTTSYARKTLSARVWWGSVAGHLGTAGASIRSRVYMLSWWAGMVGLLCAITGSEFATLFVLLWFAAKASVFHLITVFREMCDHFGLERGGVMSFSRDIVQHTTWRTLIHPRNNGYHLTHHLLPAVPYYSLPDVHRLIASMPMYLRADHAFTSYLLGARPVVDAWKFAASK